MPKIDDLLKASIGAAFLLVATATAATAGPARFRLHFIAGDEVAQHPGVVERGLDWACSAELVIAEVATMPADDAMLVPDEIHELAPDGKVLATWRVPLEADPVAIAGDTLTVIDTLGTDDPHLAVGRDGSLAVAGAQPRPADSAYAHCPANALPESGYRWCVSLPDATLGKNRLIAYNGPCT